MLARWLPYVKPQLSLLTRQRFMSTNRAAVVVGVFAVSGAILVGNVESTRHAYLHNCGALLIVVGQLAYSWMHSYLTALCPIVRHTVYLRSCLALAMTLAFITGAGSRIADR